MKGLLFLLIVCSLFINFSVNKFGWLILYRMEFPNPAEIFNSRNYDLSIVIIWGLLILSHAATVSLLFLTHKNYFSDLLFCAPLLFIIFFLFFNLLTIPLLIPFIIVWLVVLAKAFKWKIKYRVDVKPAVVAMIILSLIIGINTNGGIFSLFTVEFLIPFLSIKSGDYTLWDSILWLMLIMAHIALISIMFFKRGTQFNLFLIWAPAVFIAVFSVYNYMAFFLLIPLLTVWSIALPACSISDNVSVIGQ